MIEVAASGVAQTGRKRKLRGSLNILKVWGRMSWMRNSSLHELNVVRCVLLLASGNKSELIFLAFHIVHTLSVVGTRSSVIAWNVAGFLGQGSRFEYKSCSKVVTASLWSQDSSFWTSSGVVPELLQAPLHRYNTLGSLINSLIQEGDIEVRSVPKLEMVNQFIVITKGTRITTKRISSSLRTMFSTFLQWAEMPESQPN
ncbi:hypothetical protein C8R43DRAFT_958083 [Mycena crocata]|nr:hypothetical protein C8R43DRAFT_958083 [Mycena crocata]